MKQEKRRPTLDELKEMPTGLLKIEIAQLCFDAGLSENYDIQSQAEMLAMEPITSRIRFQFDRSATVYRAT